MAARFVRDEEVVGSNPATPTEGTKVKGLILIEDQALPVSPVIVGEKSGGRSWSGLPGRFGLTRFQALPQRSSELRNT